MNNNKEREEAMKTKTQVFKDSIRHGPWLLSIVQQRGGRASFERIVGEVADVCEVPRSEIAGSLRRLANAGYLVYRGDGQWAATPRVCSFGIIDGGERVEVPAHEIPEWARWRAVVRYRAAGASAEHVFWLEEIYDIHEAVEGGPHWDAIENITVTRVNHIVAADLTVEQAADLLAA